MPANNNKVAPLQDNLLSRNGSRSISPEFEHQPLHTKGSVPGDINSSVPWRVPNEEEVEHEIKQYWRLRHDQLVKSLRKLRSDRLYDVLGYELDLRIDVEALSGFVKQLEGLLWRLRTFDSLEGSLSYSDGKTGNFTLSDYQTMCEKIRSKAEEGNDTTFMQRKIEAVHKKKQQKKSKREAQGVDPKKDWPPHPDELMKLFHLDSRMSEDEVAVDIRKFGSRDLIILWTQLKQVVFDTWSEVSPQFSCSSEESEKYLEDVKSFVLGKGDSCSTIRNHSRIHSIGAVPEGLANHVAILCRMFNFGGLLKMAVSAKQASICRDVLTFFKAFQYLCSCFHVGSLQKKLKPSAVEEPDDDLNQTTEQENSHTVNFDGRLSSLPIDGALPPLHVSSKSPARSPSPGAIPAMTPRFRAIKHNYTDRSLCSNCNDPATNKRRDRSCLSCLGPRCTKGHVSLMEGSPVEWDYQTMIQNRKIVYYNEAWGWDWPCHPIHGRWLDGRTTLHYAAQHGNEEILDIILNEHPDLLATTFGGDTVIHMAARYDQEACMFKILSAALEPTKIPLVDLESGEIRQEENRCPLDDLRNVLEDCENRLRKVVRRRNSLAISEQVEHHYDVPCPCRRIKPMNIWKTRAQMDPENTVNVKCDLVSYATCHGDLRNTTASIPEKPHSDLCSEETEDLLAGTISVNTEFPTALRRIVNEYNEYESDFDKKTSTVEALKLFLDMRNEMGRTALHAAAAMDRDASVKALLALGGDPASRDRFHQSVLQSMVKNIPQNATQALDQFQAIDRSSRQEYFYLMELEALGDKASCELITPKINRLNPMPRTILQEIVHQDRKNLVIHPVIQQVIKLRWDMFGLKFHTWEILKYTVFLGLWLAAALMGRLNGSPPFSDSRNDYGIARIVVEFLASLMTGYYVLAEISEYRLRVQISEFHTHMETWILCDDEIGERKISSLTPTDFQHLYRTNHKRAQNSSVSYFQDMSNLIDICALSCLPASEIIQVSSALVHEYNGPAPSWPSHLSSWFLTVGLIAAFVNLMKFSRAFEMFGTFMATMGRIFDDTVRFSLLFVTVLVPFAAVFGIFFGGRGANAEPGYEDFWWSMFSVFQLAMVDGNAPEGSDGAVLYVIWVFTSAVIFLNLFIAMMSASFQEIYDTSKRVAAMEKALVVSRMEEYLYNRAQTFSIGKVLFGENANMLEYFFMFPENSKFMSYLHREYDDPDEDELETIGSMRTKLMIAIGRLNEGNEEVRADVLNANRRIHDEVLELRQQVEALTRLMNRMQRNR